MFRFVASTAMEGCIMQDKDTIFLVDDDETALDSIGYLLESAGYDVEAYASASEYLDAHDPEKTGCLVLDFRMPEMTGLELQEKLATLGARIPIIFVSAHGDVPTSVRAMKSGAFDFLEKPVDGELLLDLVGRALQKDSQLRQQCLDIAEVEARLERLTPREEEVVELLYVGKAMKQIALELEVTVQTVAKHRTSILDKMKVRSDAELVRVLADYRMKKPLIPCG